MKDKKELKEECLKLLEKIASGELTEQEAREIWHKYINTESED